MEGVAAIEKTLVEEAMGYVADSFRFRQAVLLREASFRARLYRPFAQPALEE